jgi:hypothetical protein
VGEPQHGQEAEGVEGAEFWGPGLSSDEEALLAQAREGAAEGSGGGLVAVEDALDEHPCMLPLVGTWGRQGPAELGQHQSS